MAPMVPTVQHTEGYVAPATMFILLTPLFPIDPAQPTMATFPNIFTTTPIIIATIMGISMVMGIITDMCTIMDMSILKWLMAIPQGAMHITIAATPTKLPAVYQTANYTTRLVTVPTSPTPTAEDIQLENRRVATERGAYEPRKIKPADAKPEDVFWCRERDGEWHCRPYYQIENECQPGRWQMDAEHGFLVFHRE
ncbi:hypothetical protein M011DRAFT_468936 [Sporormia fimetaria CBS 119925]|uniref:Uncharacterized protein n=1 Tax=Sporormia fimetaria CBS 119925 TaxID=1340428 RepID=A0A6A6V659_9PLEO|nr:hypothetical protein M011DRAFT_468936 [Sporormia fimetaria CBS 119925]